MTLMDAKDCVEVQWGGKVWNIEQKETFDFYDDVRIRNSSRVVDQVGPGRTRIWSDYSDTRCTPSTWSTPVLLGRRPRQSLGPELSSSSRPVSSSM